MRETASPGEHGRSLLLRIQRRHQVITRDDPDKSPRLIEHRQAPDVIRTLNYAYGPAAAPHRAYCRPGDACTLFIAFEDAVDVFELTCELSDSDSDSHGHGHGH